MSSLSKVLSVVAACAASAVPPAAVLAQAEPIGRGPPTAAARQEAPLQLALKFGGTAYELSQPARCVHAERASMFNRLGQYWQVEVRSSASNGIRSLSLTAWRFEHGGETFTFFAAVDRSSYRVSTMSGQPNQGRGTVTFTPNGSGGRFAINAVTEHGVAIEGTIDCKQVGAAIAEGG